MKLQFEIETTNTEMVAEAIQLLNGFIPTEKAKAETKTKTASKPVKTKTKPAPIDDTPKEEKAPEEPAKPVKTETKASPKTDLTLGQLKATAKEAVQRTDVDTVKKVIARYGGKLADVTENNYQALFNELEGLK